MAKHKYEELELDEHNLAIHWRERDGELCPKCQNIREQEERQAWGLF